MGTLGEDSVGTSTEYRKLDEPTDVEKGEVVTPVVATDEGGDGGCESGA